MFMSIFFIALYWKRAEEFTDINDVTAIYDINGSLFFLNMIFFMSGMMPTIMAFPVERAVFLREAGSEMYGVFPYYLAKQVTDIPLVLALPTIVSLIVHRGVGYNA